MDLSYDNLLAVLTLASSPERTGKQQEAEAQLKTWEIVPGYHYFLQQVYLTQEVPLQIRWLSIICFKNGIDKYWRSSKQYAISKDEKEQIKKNVFKLINEKNNQLMIQNAHSIARISRFDFPNEWPGLFQELAESLTGYVIANDLVSTNNLLIILNRIIKTISSVRIGKSRSAMQQSAGGLISVLFNLYMKSFQEWTDNLNLSLMEICYLTLKNLRRILPETFDQLIDNQEFGDFLNISVDHMQLLIVEHDKYSSDLIERYVKCYSKLYLDLLNGNPTNFVLMPCSKKILTTYISLLDHKADSIYHSNEENDFWEILALKGFLILKRIITYLFKKGAITLRQRNNKEQVEKSVADLKQYFSPDLLQNICDLIITWYLKLKPSDLESWQIEPEEWFSEELSSNWEYQIRACAENLFQDMIKFFRDDLGDFVIQKISSTIAGQDPSIDSSAEVSDALLVRDSIFCTFQLSSHSIADQANFDQLLTEIFLPQGYKTKNKIIQRRICLILNEWVLVQCSKQNKVEVYKLLNHFLATSNDKIVQISAVQTFKIIIKDWDFVKTDFKPFLTETIMLVIGALNRMQLVETKLFILDTLSVIIEQNNPLISRDSLFEILSMIPAYWEAATSSAQNESILRNSLLRLLKTLVVSLNENSQEAHSFILPVINNCCSPSSADYSLLSEDGYELWLAVLQFNQGKADDSLIKLYELIPFALMNSTEILPIILSIVRSYSLYDFPLSQTPITSEIFKILAGYLTTMRDDSFNIFIALMDILFLKLSNNEAFIESMINSGLFKTLMEYVFSDTQSISQINKVFVVFSRLSTYPDIFLKILGHLNIEPKLFVGLWLRMYTNNGNPRNKKINLMGLLNLISFSMAQSIALPEELLDSAKRTLFFLEEVNESDQGTCEAYQQDFVYEDIDDYSYLDPEIKPHGEKIRYQHLLDACDPVYKTNLKAFLKERLELIKDKLGNGFEDLINDQYVRDQLGMI